MLFYSRPFSISTHPRSEGIVPLRTHPAKSVSRVPQFHMWISRSQMPWKPSKPRVVAGVARRSDSPSQFLVKISSTLPPINKERFWQGGPGFGHSLFKGPRCQVPCHLVGGYLLSSWFSLSVLQTCCGPQSNMQRSVGEISSMLLACNRVPTSAHPKEFTKFNIQLMGL